MVQLAVLKQLILHKLEFGQNSKVCLMGGLINNQLVQVSVDTGSGEYWCNFNRHEFPAGASVGY